MLPVFESHFTPPPGKDRVQYRFVSWDLGGESMRDSAHATAQLAQIDKSFPLPKNFTTVVGPDIATGDFQQRRFAGTIRTDHGPVLAGIDLPRHVRQDGLPARTEADIADFKQG